ncbi:CGNR zinc finger domain-containing protein [Streptomyces sp. NPDC059866]|uniref:CGNR zinc finger domain-containing protein n=1 Tax=Streptomyces sp. NPDC059866 TaxID=3346978 RepID=UPI00364908C0
MSYTATERFGMESAPGGLALVQDLLNTIGVGGPSHPDLLQEVRPAQEWLNAALERWAEATGAGRPPDIALTERDLPRLRALRDRLRAGLNHQNPSDAEPTRPGPEPTGSLRLALTSDGRIEVHPEGRGARWITSSLLGEIYDAQQNDTWRRLKICRSEKCAVAFYDRSRNNSGVWHDVRVCGNAVNLRASRARRRQLP